MLIRWFCLITFIEYLLWSFMPNSLFPGTVFLLFPILIGSLTPNSLICSFDYLVCGGIYKFFTNKEIKKETDGGNCPIFFLPLMIWGFIGFFLFVYGFFVWADSSKILDNISREIPLNTREASSYWYLTFKDVYIQPYFNYLLCPVLAINVLISWFIVEKTGIVK